VLTDIHAPEEAAVAAEVADCLTNSCLSVPTDGSLAGSCHSGRVVNVKKGQFLAPWDIEHAAQKVASTGNRQILLTERGCSFGYNNLVSDFVLCLYAQLVTSCYDATHSVQCLVDKATCPADNVEFVRPLARAAVAVGVDGLSWRYMKTPRMR